MTTTYWFFFAATLALTGFIGYGTFATEQLLREWQPKRNLLLLPAENLVRLLLIAFCIVLGLISGVSYSQLGWITADLGQQFVEGLLWGGLLALGLVGSTRLIMRYGGEHNYSSAVIKAITPHNRRELILVLLAMIPVVVLEELLFRSLLLGGFAPLLPLPFLLLSWSVAFGLLHSPQGLWGMVGAGIAGLLLGLLFLYRGSLLLPIVAHYVANSVQIIQAMRLGYGSTREHQPGTG